MSGLPLPGSPIPESTQFLLSGAAPDDCATAVAEATELHFADHARALDKECVRMLDGRGRNDISTAEDSGAGFKLSFWPLPTVIAHVLPAADLAELAARVRAQRAAAPLLAAAGASLEQIAGKPIYASAYLARAASRPLPTHACTLNRQVHDVARFDTDGAGADSDADSDADNSDGPDGHGDGSGGAGGHGDAARVHRDSAQTPSGGGGGGAAAPAVHHGVAAALHAAFHGVADVLVLDADGVPAAADADADADADAYADAAAADGLIDIAEAMDAAVHAAIAAAAAAAAAAIGGPDGRGHCELVTATTGRPIASQLASMMAASAAALPGREYLRELFYEATRDHHDDDDRTVTVRLCSAGAAAALPFLGEVAAAAAAEAVAPASNSPASSASAAAAAAVRAPTSLVSADQLQLGDRLAGPQLAVHVGLRLELPTPEVAGPEGDRPASTDALAACSCCDIARRRHAADLAAGSGSAGADADSGSDSDSDESHHGGPGGRRIQGPLSSREGRIGSSTAGSTSELLPDCDCDSASVASCTSDGKASDEHASDAEPGSLSAAATTATAAAAGSVVALALAVDDRDGELLEQDRLDRLQLSIEDHGADPAAFDDELLRTAAAEGHASVVAYLLADRRVNPLARSNQAYRRAAARGNVAVLEVLRADPRVALYLAAEAGDTEALDSALTVCAASSSESSMVAQSPAEAVSAASTPSAGAGSAADTSAQAAGGKVACDVHTAAVLALRKAAANGHLAAVDRLLTSGLADPLAFDNGAYRSAVQHKRDAVVARLAADGRVRLLLACVAGDVAAVDACLADPLVDPGAGDVAVLRVAARHGQLAVVDRLLADPRVWPSALDHAALRAAAKHGHAAVIRRLLADARCALDEKVLEPDSIGFKLPAGVHPTRGYAGIAAALAAAFTEALAEATRVPDLLNRPAALPVSVRPLFRFSAAARASSEAVKLAVESGRLEALEALLADPRVSLRSHWETCPAVDAALASGQTPMLAALLKDVRIQDIAADLCRAGTVQAIARADADMLDLLIRFPGIGSEDVGRTTRRVAKSFSPPLMSVCLAHPAAKVTSREIAAAVKARSEPALRLLLSQRTLHFEGENGSRLHSAWKAAFKPGNNALLELLLRDARLACGVAVCVAAACGHVAGLGTLLQHWKQWRLGFGATGHQNDHDDDHDAASGGAMTGSLAPGDAASKQMAESLRFAPDYIAQAAGAAAAAGQVATLQALLEDAAAGPLCTGDFDSDVDSILIMRRGRRAGRRQSNALGEASMHGRDDAVALLLAHGLVAQPTQPGGAGDWNRHSNFERASKEILAAAPHALRAAARAGHVRAVQMLAQMKTTSAAVLLSSNDMTSALAVAAENGHSKVVQFLLQHLHSALRVPALVLPFRSDVFDAFSGAVMEGHADAAKLALHADLPGIRGFDGGDNYLRSAVARGCGELVRLMLQDCDVHPEDADTAQNMVERAAMDGHLTALLHLLADPKVDAAACGTAALPLAAAAGNRAIVAFLLSLPAVDPAAADNEAIVAACGVPPPPFHACADGAHDHSGDCDREGVVELLLGDPRVDPSARGNAALRAAAANGYTGIVARLLADRRVSPTAAIPDVRGSVAVLEMLLADARVNDAERDGAIDRVADLCLAAHLQRRSGWVATPDPSGLEAMLRQLHAAVADAELRGTAGPEDYRRIRAAERLAAAPSFLHYLAEADGFRPMPSILKPQRVMADCAAGAWRRRRAAVVGRLWIAPEAASSESQSHSQTGPCNAHDE